MADSGTSKDSSKSDGGHSVKDTASTSAGAGASEAETEPKPAVTPTPPSSIPPTRPPYIPQFTAATQMILSRLKGEPSSLSTALSQAARSPSVTSAISTSSYEDVKRRLVMSMNTSTSLTMKMPSSSSTQSMPATLPMPSAMTASTTPTTTTTTMTTTTTTAAAAAVNSTSATTTIGPARSSISTAGMSAIRKVQAGLTSITKSPVAKVAQNKTAPMENKIKKLKTSAIVPRGVGSKRKRARNKDDDDDDDDASSASSFSEQSGSEAPTDGASQSMPLTTTKSGRSVMKPDSYNPAAMEAASKKRANYGKRTAEQALCKKCTRMYSPAGNRMVFCDGCNDGWHQLCHDPWIQDDIVGDQARGWFCSACTTKRHQQQQQQQQQQPQQQPQPKRQKTDPRPARESWASRPPQQKRAYLSTLSQQELVSLLMLALEMHPDLPIFPASPSGAGASSSHGTAGQAPRSLFAGTSTDGLFSRAEAHPTGQINYVRKISNANGNGNGKGRGSANGTKKEKEETPRLEEEEGFDPLAALWPKPGMGLYRQLPPDTEDNDRLVDQGDFEAFSSIIFDDRGRKVEENGMPV